VRGECFIAEVSDLAGAVLVCEKQLKFEETNNTLTIIRISMNDE